MNKFSTISIIKLWDVKCDGILWDLIFGCYNNLDIMDINQPNFVNEVNYSKVV
jgi:hypothetical protein